jgi:hypothetical protein
MSSMRSARPPSPKFTWTPLVVQFIGIAEAGQSKSTLLKEINGPLRYALDRKGADHRRALVERPGRRPRPSTSRRWSATDDRRQHRWTRSTTAALCPSSVTDQGTQEGIRKNLIQATAGTGDPHRRARRAAARSASTSSKVASGSLGLMLRGWGQEPLDGPTASRHR